MYLLWCCHDLDPVDEAATDDDDGDDENQLIKYGIPVAAGVGLIVVLGGITHCATSRGGGGRYATDSVTSIESRRSRRSRYSARSRSSEYDYYWRCVKRRKTGTTIAKKRVNCYVIYVWNDDRRWLKRLQIWKMELGRSRLGLGRISVVTHSKHTKYVTFEVISKHCFFFC